MSLFRQAYAVVATELPTDWLAGSPLQNVRNILAAGVNIVFWVGVAICLIFAIIGGIQYAMAGGDPKAATAARNTITNAVIGFVVVLGFRFIMGFVVRLLGGAMPTELLPGY